MKYFVSTVVIFCNKITAATSDNLTLTFGLVNFQVTPQQKEKYLCNRSTFYLPGGIDSTSLIESHLFFMHPNVNIAFKFYDSLYNRSNFYDASTVVGALIAGKVITGNVV